MEILKVGDEFSVFGYKAITLSEDMQSNVNQFAKVNGIEVSEAERILNGIPALQDFIASIYSTDEEEDIVITDFNLDDDIPEESSNQSTGLTGIFGNMFAEKTSAANPVEKTQAANNNNADDEVEGITPANPSTSNESDLKDLLGIFGLPTTTSVTNIEYDDDGNARAFTLNDKRYEVELEKDEKGKYTGIVKTTISDRIGNVTKGQYPPPDPLIAQIEEATNLIINVVKPLIAAECKVFREDHEFIKLRDTILQFVANYNYGITADSFISTLGIAIAEAGFDTRELHYTIDRTSKGTTIKELARNLTNLIYEKIEKERIEEKYTNQTIEVGGAIFKIRYLTNDTNKCNITESNSGEIVIDGKNCEVDLMGYGEVHKEIKITGDNVTFRGNAVTADKITNTAKNSNITGSFGNDTINNMTSAFGSTINGGDGDDKLWNYGENVHINGNNGNDTVVNYGNNATINGGDDDDSINYVKGTARIIASKGNDTEHYIDARIESDDPDWKFAKKYSMGGITFIAYAQEDDFSGLNLDMYKNLLTINASDMKIRVIGGTKELGVKLTGSNMLLQTDVQLKAVFNHADNSSIIGSKEKDRLYNYADDSSLNGQGGDDLLTNDGSRADVDGGEGSDRIYNRKNGDNTTIHNDGQDKIYNENTTATTVLPKGDMSDSEYNMAINLAYIDAELSGSNVPLTPNATATMRSHAKNLASKLVTTDNSGRKAYSDLAKELIGYAKRLNEAIGIINSMQLLKIALNSLDKNKDGDITSAELDELSAKIEELDAEANKEKQLDKIKSEIQSAVGLSSTQMSNFLASYKTPDEAMKILKEIKAIINSVSNSAVSLNYTMANIKDIMLSGNGINFNNEILADAAMLVEASESDNPEAYIKSKMIKDGSSETLAQLGSSTKPGDVVEKGGKLYVNDNGKMIELNISADTYMELFPPIERYFVEQNSYNDCFFIATTLVEAMETPAARAKILQMFSENARGDISITFPGIGDGKIAVTFNGGKPFTTDNEWDQGGLTYEYKKAQTPTTACLGETLLEQAYALAKFTEISNSNLSTEDIGSIYSKEMANAIADDGKVTNINNLDIDKALLFYVDGGYATEVLDDLFGETSNGSDKYTTFNGKSTTTLTQLMATTYANSLNKNTILTTLISGTIEISDADYQTYNIISGHQYSIERINTTEKTVTIKNPWDPYKTIDIPYDVFFKYFYGVLNRTIN